MSSTATTTEAVPPIVSKDAAAPTRKKQARVLASSLHQRQPSLWMLLAMAQSALFMFGLPLLCREHIWDQVFGRFISSHPRHGQSIAEFIFTASITPVFFVIYTLVMIPIYKGNFPFFEQYKIQQNTTWPWFDPNPKIRADFWKLSKKSLKLSALNMCVLLPVLAAGKIYVEREILQLDKSFFFQTTDEHWPSTTKNIRDVLLMIFVHEFGFYTTHKMMHSYPWLYRYHKVHHEYKMNTTLAAQHNHPVDYLVSASGPAVLAVFLVESHSISQFQYILWILMANLDDHVGYAFPWSPCRWFPGSCLTDEHEFHHSQNMGCFSTKLSCFNLMFGGYEHYDKYYGNETRSKKDQ